MEDNRYTGNNYYYQATNSNDKVVDAKDVTIEDAAANVKAVKLSKFRRNILKAVAIAAAVGVVGGGAFSASSTLLTNALNGTTDTSSAQDASATTVSSTDTTKVDSTDTSDSTTTLDVSEVVDNVMPSIVAITVVSTEEVSNMFGQTQSYESEGAGSGIIVEQDDDYLYIVTNNHVVEGATSVSVQFCDDTSVTAQIQGTDSDSDLAIVKVSIDDIDSDTISQIKVATLGDSDELSVGDTAIAIGNALGYGQSVTTGVISALNREVTTEDETTGSSITNELIQTDAAINPGNSGGALINQNGEVIGINSSKYADTDVEGMGFAIPINDAVSIIKDIIENGSSSSDSDSEGTAYLGIAGVDVTQDIAQSYSMPEGAYISQVTSGSAADEAGLVVGEIITAIDGNEVTSFEELANYIAKYNAGDEVTLTVAYQSGDGYEEQKVSVTLGEKATTDDSQTDESEQYNQQQGQMGEDSPF